METQRTISSWAQDTFGEVGAVAVATRMNVEVAELQLALVVLAGLSEGHPLYDALKKNLDVANSIAGMAASLDLEFVVERCNAEAFLDARGECADVLVMLYQVASLLGGDLHRLTDAKMSRNRKRTWGRAPNGTMQHTAEGV